MTLKSMEPIMYFKVGKKKFIAFNYIDFLTYLTGLSKSEVKRLFKQKAIDIYIPEPRQ